MHLKGASNPSSNGNNNVFWIISVLSWLILLVTSWLSIGLPYSNQYKIFWLTNSLISFEDEESEYNPISLHIVFHYIVFIFSMVLTTIGFLIYITYRDDNNIIDGMLGNISKFHFIPLLCISALFIIGESKEEPNVAMYIFDFIFSIIGLTSLILVKIKTKIESPWYAIFTIKKGVYSCFIALLTYNICYNFTYYGIYEINESDDLMKNWKIGCGITFPIIIGIVNLALSVIFQDIMIAFMNLLIFVGMIINFYITDEEIRAAGEGIVDIIFLSLSGCTILFLSLLYRSKLYT